MSHTLTGRAAVFALNGSLTFTGIATNAALLPQGAEFSHDAEVKQDLTDPTTGEVIGKAYGRETRSISVDIIPASDGVVNSGTAAKSALALPSIPSLVTLSGFDHADINGDYLYEGGGRISFSLDGYAKMSLPLKRYLSTQSTAAILSTEVTG